MPELSPAAQAVLDAAIKVAESPDAEAIAAAALRAAATMLRDAYADEEYVDPRRMPQRLDGIAAELEAQ